MAEAFFPCSVDTKLAAHVQALDIRDTSETQIHTCTWNIDGKAKAALRKEVTTSTLNERYYQDGRTSLNQSDIICVQEMTVKATTDKAAEYLPFARDYGVVQSKEPTGKYNAVYYNKEKFNQVDIRCLKPAYALMEFKSQCCDYIERGKDARIKKAIRGELEEWGDSDDKKNTCQEVLRECRKLCTIQEFKTKISSKYRAPGEVETNCKDPFDLLNRRMAICVLNIKSLPEQHIIAISVHNYSARSGKPAAENYVSLLFDFISKLWYTSFKFIVIIAGDFNLDIRHNESLVRYLCASYRICDYTLRSLRSDSGKMIDFIVVAKPRHNLMLEFTVKEAQAHDLIISREVNEELIRLSRSRQLEHMDSYITNHNPVSAVIELKL